MHNENGAMYTEEELHEAELEEDNLHLLAEESEGSSELTASEDEASWISWFTNLRGNDFFCAIDEEYIHDDFNLTGLDAMVPHYKNAIKMILDIEIKEDLTEEQSEALEIAAEVLYGLIHARYILTNRGIQRMFEKYQNADFGSCPRVYCQGQPVLPVGLSDVPRTYAVNVYCPRCQELYYPRSTKQANLDGAYFGTTFTHLFLLLNPEQIPPPSQQNYVPKIHGFRIHKDSEYYKQRDQNSKQRGGSRAIEGPK